MAAEQREPFSENANMHDNREIQELVGCPFLGLFDDAETTLAYPSKANHCHRLQTPVGVDLAHQGEYCLSRNFPQCYVYGKLDAVPEEQKEPRTAVLLASLVALRNRFPASPDFEAWRASLPALSQAGDRVSVEAYVASLKERLPRTDDISGRIEAALAALSLPALRARLPQDVSKDALQSYVKHINRRTAGLFAVPIFLMLIVLAAIIWWPPVGGTEPDALAMIPADPSTHDTAGRFAATAPHAAETRPAAVPDAPQPSRSGESGATAELLAATEITTAADEDEMALAVDQAGQGQGATAVSLDTEALAEPMPETVVEAEETEIKEIPVITAATAKETPVEANETNEGTETSEEKADAADAVSESPGTAATADEVGELIANSEDDGPLSTAAANDETTAISPLPAADIASVGPVAATEPLLIHDSPDDTAEIISSLTERQPAAVLGRDSSSSWILIRLGAGIEGWVRVQESGANMVMADLPNVTTAGEAAAATAAPPNSVQPVEEDLPVVGTAVVNAGALNLRSGPGIEYTPVGYVFNRQPVSLLGQYGGQGNVWVLVRTSDGQQGWMNSLYLIQTE